VRKLQADGPAVASRKASQMALDAFGPKLPELIGGSADLAGSNLTIWKGSKDVNSSDAAANYVYYGVREFGMTAISSGLALHGGFIPYDATFLVFSDYARNAVRMSALIPAHAIHVYTHDSIGLGEDGPTHQPIEHLASLRYIPHNHVWRPCDAVESAVAWKAAIERKDGPSCLVFSRQTLAHQQRSEAQLATIEFGGYVLSDPPSGKFDVILMATGSEVGLAMDSMRALEKEGVAARVVSMPCANLFDRQPQDYRDSVLPPSCRKRVAVEAGVTDYWRKYVGLDGAVIGIDRFGASAPAEALFKYFGFTVDEVVAAVKRLG
jgi:transketolase